MFFAQKLDVKVRLCPYIHENTVKLGDLNNSAWGDLCIVNIVTNVDSEKAICSWEPDKEAIHSTIRLEFSNGFNEINKSVEKVRLQYLLEYPVDKITGFHVGFSAEDDHNSKPEMIKRQRDAIKILFFAITTMVNRVYSIVDNEIPKFEDFETKSGLLEPMEMFREWKEVIEKIIHREEKKVRKSKRDNFTIWLMEINCCLGRGAYNRE